MIVLSDDLFTFVVFSTTDFQKSHSNQVEESARKEGTVSIETVDLSQVEGYGMSS